jgi:cell division protein FtsL
MKHSRQTLLSVLRGLLVPGALAALFVAAGVLHVTSRVLVVNAGYGLSRLEAEYRQLALENDRLRLELATLKNPARLERYARTRLGMGPPAPAAVLIPGPALQEIGTPSDGAAFVASTLR